MEPKAVEYDNWDDLVFENRNKAYGAYALRKAYNNVVMFGFGLSVALIALLLLLPKGSKPEIIPVPKLPTIIFTNPPIIEPRIKELPKPQPPVRRVENVNTNTAPVITTETVENTVMENSQQTVEEGSVNGAVDGTGIIETPVTEAQGTPVVEQTEFKIVEQMPVYTGGNQAMYEFLSRRMRYPSGPRRLGIEGTVYVSFLVMGDGSVADVKVERGIHPDCDKEAVRVISLLPGWVGGKQGGRPVNVRMVLPIKFHLSK